MNKSKIFAFLVIVAAAVSLSSCNRGTGCPSDNMDVQPIKIVSSLLK